MKWSKNQVDEYFKIMENNDNTFVIEKFKSEVGRNSKVLELGFGCGNDYLALKNKYQITISDYSDEFVKRFNLNNEDKAIVLDALTINIDQKFDVIYSNKVLQVFTDDEMTQSLKRQANILNDSGLIFHTLWFGDEPFELDNYYCNFVNIGRLEKMLANNFHIIDLIIYTEIEENDSIILIAKKI